MTAKRVPIRDEDRSGDSASAWDRALHILELSDRTEREMRLKLAVRFTDEAVEETVVRLKAHGYIDDKRYAVRYLQNRSHDKGRSLVKRELILGKGVPGEIAEEALRECPPSDEKEKIRRWMSRKNIDPESADEKELERFYRAMQRRGFAASDILSVMKKDFY